MNTPTKIDTHYMHMALELAQKGLYTTRPNPAVGCVIVRFDDGYTGSDASPNKNYGTDQDARNIDASNTDAENVAGKIVGTGFHPKAGEPHAEVFALREAGNQAQGATAYVTLEPCAHHGRTPPCAEALIKAGIARVVVAVKDPNPKVGGKGITMLQEAGIAVTLGVCEAQACAINAGFLKVMAGGLPYVRLKIAASLDGCTAMASGESKWITGKAARADVQRLRALSGAIITGSGTVLADNPKLNIRQDIKTTKDIENIPLNSIPQPISVILDRRGRIDDAMVDKLAIFDNEQVLLFSGGGDRLQAKNAKRYKKYTFKDLASVLQTLRDDHEVRDILVEAGSTLATAFLQAGLVDELILYQAPMLLGNTARPMLDMTIDKLAAAQRFELCEASQVGGDVRLRLIKGAFGR